MIKRCNGLFRCIQLSHIHKKSYVHKNLHRPDMSIAVYWDVKQQKTEQTKPPLNAHVDVSSGTRVGLSLYLRPYFVYASSDGSGKSVH